MNTRLPVYLVTARDRIKARYDSPAGRRELQHLLEASDYDRAAAWRQFAARACPSLPEGYLEDAINLAREAIKAERRARMIAAEPGEAA
jgi:hypothetical protein